MQCKVIGWWDSLGGLGFQLVLKDKCKKGAEAKMNYLRALDF